MEIAYKHEIPAEAYLYFREAVGFHLIEKEQAEISLKNAAFLIVAYDGERPVGMARVVSDGGYIALIADVMVLPDYQGQGIGKYMMEKVMAYLQGSIKEGQSLFINLMAAKGKEEFYKKFQFEERPSDQVGSGMALWLTA